MLILSCRYVKNAEVEGNFYRERQQELQLKKDRLIKETQADQSAKATAATRKEAAEALASLVAVPRDLLNAAVQLIKQHTAAGAAYAAIVTDPEEPDWAPPEDDDAAAVESEDEGEAAAAEGAETGADEELAPEPEAMEAEGGEDSEGGAGVAKKIPRPVDYSKKYFAYVAASAGQEHVLGVDLRRPAPPPEDAAEEDSKPEPVPYSFRVLDEKLPMLYVPNVANKDRIKFFRNFPKIGSYQACGITLPSSGEFKALLAADTLFPEGSGQPLTPEDRDFVWEVSQSLAKALGAVAAEAAAGLTATSAAETLEALKSKLVELRTQAAAEVAIAAPPPAGDGEEEEVPPEEEPAPEEPEEEEEEEGEEGEEGEDGEPPKPKKKKKVIDPIPGIQAAIAKLTETTEKAAEAEAHARTALELEQQALQAVVQAAAESSSATLTSLRHMLSVPQATFHVLKALLHLLGRQPDTFATWKLVYAHLTPALFEDMAAYDATQERDLELWGRVRQCYKAVSSAKKLEAELPNTGFGVIALTYIKQVRRVARKAVLHRTVTAKLEKARTDLEAKKVALEEAERAKAEAEAEAARLAEEEAARAAAAAEAAAAAAAEAGEGEAALGEGEAEEGEGGEEEN
ncbi:hypothetical protein GPECTOR_1g66 [Gonium pectorale]|uniref:Uncharacterized protein n=1 Tax=Gonium pectorale TaxID=33097 RepID=A0A150H3W3_GONPE|nr:hypothetical protein GPECTOR_1g66 [Gonium pectorale]|eukprot:KXZ56732.1 hypothetical protein GPECTOR_1g66 [Gonium pectorale]